MTKFELDLHNRMIVSIYQIVEIMFVCFEPHEQFFSYLAAVTIVSDRTANLDPMLSSYGF
jgi:hypothetical protein